VSPIEPDFVSKKIPKKASERRTEEEKAVISSERPNKTKRDEKETKRK
jgi:hypothetical protein